jgi:hypothetical protein
MHQLNQGVRYEAAPETADVLTHVWQVLECNWNTDLKKFTRSPDTGVKLRQFHLPFFSCTMAGGHITVD